MLISFFIKKYVEIVMKVTMLIVLSFSLTAFLPNSFADVNYVLTSEGFVIEAINEDVNKVFIANPTFTKKNKKYSKLVSMISNNHNVEPSLIHAMIKTESNYKIKAVSSAGAKGLMQLMDKTAKHYNVTDVFDPFENINAGTHLMRDLLDRYKNVRLALAAYNAGIKAVDKYNGIPPYTETKNYVKKIMTLYKSDFGGLNFVEKKGIVNPLMVKIPKKQTLLFNHYSYR
jgi:soluble lytic murein transglycosylase-like protein